KPYGRGRCHVGRLRVKIRGASTESGQSVSHAWLSWQGPDGPAITGTALVARLKGRFRTFKVSPKDLAGRGVDNPLSKRPTTKGETPCHIPARQALYPWRCRHLLLPKHPCRSRRARTGAFFRSR